MSGIGPIRRSRRQRDRKVWYCALADWKATPSSLASSRMISPIRLATADVSTGSVGVSTWRSSARAMLSSMSSTRGAGGGAGGGGALATSLARSVVSSAAMSSGAVSGSAISPSLRTWLPVFTGPILHAKGNRVIAGPSARKWPRSSSRIRSACRRSMPSKSAARSWLTAISISPLEFAYQYK